MKLVAPLLALTTTILPIRVLAQGGTTVGGWYVHQEALVCLSECDPLQKCSIVGSPSRGDIDAACKKITSDCADGVLSSGQTYHGYGTNGFLGTAGFATGSSAGNVGCPNTDECQQCFEYLRANMRYPSAPGSPKTFCSSASIEIRSHRHHAKTGTISVHLPTLRRA